MKKWRRQYSMHNHAVFLRLARLLTFFPVSAAETLDLAATVVLLCLLASIYFCSFSGRPLFLAALILALVNDFADNGVLIENPYFFLYSFWLIPWATRCFVDSCRISLPHSRQITLSFWMESAGLSTGFSSVGASPATSAVGANSIPPASAFYISWRVLKTCRREAAISAAGMGVKETCLWTISAAISMSFFGI
jgi:hypothetical protein